MSGNLPALPDLPNLRLFHITIHFHKELDTEGLKKAFEKALDWIHYMPNCWMVLTSSDEQRWYGRLMPLLGDADTMLICQVDPKKIYGWMERWVIDWINQSQERIEKSRTT